MADNKLDGKFVEYDLETAINVLPTEHGGTGRANFAIGDNDHILIYNGSVEEIQAINLSGTLLRQAMVGYNIANLTIEQRLVAAKNHIDTSSLHLPTGGSNSTFLRGDRTWQSISSSASSVYCTDEFTKSNATNVQDVLDDLDAAIYANEQAILNLDSGINKHFVVASVFNMPTTWTDVPGLSITANFQNAPVCIAASMWFGTDFKDYYMRLLIDGTEVQRRGENYISSSYNNQYEMNLIWQQVLSGTHTIKIQVMGDAGISTNSTYKSTLMTW